MIKEFQQFALFGKTVEVAPQIFDWTKYTKH